MEFFLQSTLLKFACMTCQFIPPGRQLCKQAAGIEYRKAYTLDAVLHGVKWWLKSSTLEKKKVFTWEGKIECLMGELRGLIEGGGRMVEDKCSISLITLKTWDVSDIMAAHSFFWKGWWHTVTYCAVIVAPSHLSSWQWYSEENRSTVISCVSFHLRQ